MAFPSQAERSRSMSAQEIMCGTSMSPTGSYLSMTCEGVRKLLSRPVQKVGAAIAEDVVCAFGEDGVVAHVADEMGQVVVVDQFGVAEDAGFLAEHFFDQLVMQLDLLAEFLARVEEGERVIVSFRK